MEDISQSEQLKSIADNFKGSAELHKKLLEGYSITGKLSDKDKEAIRSNYNTLSANITNDNILYINDALSLLFKDAKMLSTSKTDIGEVIRTAQANAGYETEISVKNLFQQITNTMNEFKRMDSGKIINLPEGKMLLVDYNVIIDKTAFINRESLTPILAKKIRDYESIKILLTKSASKVSVMFNDSDLYYASFTYQDPISLITKYEDAKLLLGLSKDLSTTKKRKFSEISGERPGFRAKGIYKDTTGSSSIDLLNKYYSDLDKLYNDQEYINYYNQFVKDFIKYADILYDKLDTDTRLRSYVISKVGILYWPVFKVYIILSTLNMEDHELFPYYYFSQKLTGCYMETSNNIYKLEGACDDYYNDSSNTNNIFDCRCDLVNIDSSINRNLPNNIGNCTISSPGAPQISKCSYNAPNTLLYRYINYDVSNIIPMMQYISDTFFPDKNNTLNVLLLFGIIIIVITIIICIFLLIKYFK